MTVLETLSPTRLTLGRLTLGRPTLGRPTLGRPPTVSIVIPAYDEAAVIERCVRAALEQTVPALEIIVVDNRSHDDTAAIVEALAARPGGERIRLVRQDALQGITPTRDAGFASARGDVIGRIDADTVIDPDWVEHVAERMADPGVGAITGPVAYYDLPHPRAGRVADDLARRAFRGLGREYPFLYGSNMAIRATAWRQVRDAVCADPDDLMHEDLDLAVHLYEAGIPVAYAPDVRAAVSARRMAAGASDFRDYTRRFERTYARHGIRHWHLRAPEVVLRGLYWSLRATRAFRR